MVVAPPVVRCLAQLYLTIFCTMVSTLSSPSAQLSATCPRDKQCREVKWSEGGGVRVQMLALNLANVKLISFFVAMWDGEGEQAANCKLTDQRIITGLHIHLSYQENDNIFPRCTALGCWVIIMCTCSQYTGHCAAPPPVTHRKCPAHCWLL